MSRRKSKPFQASKEVKRQARLRVGAPPPSRRLDSLKGRQSKHKKRQMEQENL